MFDGSSLCYESEYIAGSLVRIPMMYPLLREHVSGQGELEI